jgi:hypothetical protein
MVNIENNFRRRDKRYYIIFAPLLLNLDSREIKTISASDATTQT